MLMRMKLPQKQKQCPPLSSFSHRFLQYVVQGQESRITCSATSYLLPLSQNSQIFERGCIPWQKRIYMTKWFTAFWLQL